MLQQFNEFDCLLIKICWIMTVVKARGNQRMVQLVSIGESVNNQVAFRISTKSAIHYIYLILRFDVCAWI